MTNLVMVGLSQAEPDDAKVLKRHCNGTHDLMGWVAFYSMLQLSLSRHKYAIFRNSPLTQLPESLCSALTVRQTLGSTFCLLAESSSEYFTFLQRIQMPVTVDIQTLLRQTVGEWFVLQAAHLVSWT